MNILVFPSTERPQIYLSDSNNTVNFFINNFFYSGKTGVQRLINISRSILPMPLMRLILRRLLSRQGLPPGELNEMLASIRKFVTVERNVFPGGPHNSEKVNFILRKSAWERTDSKCVVILFADNSSRPFAVAKAGTPAHRVWIEREYGSTKEIYLKLKEVRALSIPEPLAFYCDDRAAVYFEKAIQGEPLNNYIKLVPCPEKREDIFAEVIEMSRDFLLNLKRSERPMDDSEFNVYFKQPARETGNSGFALKHRAMFLKIEEAVKKLEGQKIFPVWMHGDLWGGSILYNRGRIGVIDWEFFSERGVPLWDLFSLLFHLGAAVHEQSSPAADFMNYFNSPKLAGLADAVMLHMAGEFKIDRDFIPTLFESYLLFNMYTRDTDKEKYWQTCLEKYWATAGRGTDKGGERLL